MTTYDSRQHIGVRKQPKRGTSGRTMGTRGNYRSYNVRARRSIYRVDGGYNDTTITTTTSISSVINTSTDSTTTNNASTNNASIVTNHRSDTCVNYYSHYHYDSRSRRYGNRSNGDRDDHHSNRSNRLYMMKRTFGYSEASKHNRIHKLLYDTPESLKAKFRWDDEALWSLTHLQIGKEICDQLLKFDGITRNSSMVDAFASVGGNTIQFARAFKHVYAAELNADRFTMLKYNLALYSLDNITAYFGYYQNMEIGKCDVTFFDPPWGLNYKDFVHGTMHIRVDEPTGESSSIESLVRRSKTKYNVIKLPQNYDFGYFEKSIIPARIIKKTSYGRPNSFVCIYTYNDATK